MIRPQPSGYWCELVARSPDLGEEWYVAGTWVDSSGAAWAWLRERAWRLAETLASPVGETFAEWVDDLGYQATQRDALEEGLPVSANAGSTERVCGTGDVYVFYSLTCRPVFRRMPAERAPL